MRDNNPVAGALYLLRGLRVLGAPGVRRYVAAPLLINTTLFAVGIWYAFTSIAGLLDGLLPAWLEWLQWLLLPLLALAVLVVVFFTFSVVANFIAAPFNGMLAAAVERHAAGRTAHVEGGIAAEFARTMRSEFAKLRYTATRGLPLLLLMLVPGVNVVVTPLWLLFSAWMQSLQHTDFAMGNHGIGFTEQRAVHARRRWLSLGFGAAVTATLLVPLLNFLVMPAAVAGATLMWLERLESAPEPRPDRL